MNSHVAVALSPDGIAEVRLDRPDKLNALVNASFEDLVATASRLSRDSSVRAVILHGAGRAFCAGLDLSNFDPASETSVGRDALATRTHGVTNLYQQAVMAWRDLPVPVIAAVHGVAFGGGLQLALGADVRLVRPDAQLSVMEIKWGIVPDMAGFVLMPQVTRADVMRELVYTGRIVSGEEAVALGLATRACEAPLEEARHLASEIAQRSPQAIRSAKRLLNRSFPGDPAPLLLAESQEQDRLLGSVEQKETVRANLEGRAPQYTASASIVSK
ncbi:crotonase/enoyl-CoA hydratase family protein [Burkholderia stagnalis]